MDIFDIIGPVMVGPSSSHTAGAVRIGYVGQKLLGEPVARAKIGLYGSFWSTGRGHGTDRALVAGLMGWDTQDKRIPDSFAYAEKQGMEVSFYQANLKEAHPNTAVLHMTGIDGRELEVIAASVGGGRIWICEVDGLTVNVSGEHPTLIVHNQDQPGHVAEAASMLSHKSVNIATMQLYRDSRGGNAVMVLECDQQIPEEAITWLEHLEGVMKVTYLNL